MADKKRTRVGPAVVSINAMSQGLSEEVVSAAAASLQ